MADKLKGGIIGGSVDLSIPVILRQTTDNKELKGITYSLALASYWRQGAIRTSILLVSLVDATSAHTDGGWVEVNSIAMPGVYRMDLPDAAIAAAVDWVVVSAVSTSTSSYLWVQEYTLTGDPASSLGFANMLTTTQGNALAASTALTAYGGLTLAQANALAASSALTAYAPLTTTQGNALAASLALTSYAPLTTTQGNALAASSALTAYGALTLTQANALAASTALTAYDALIPADLAVAVSSLAAYVTSLRLHDDALAASLALTAYDPPTWAEVNALAASLALTAYDPPTKAEMDALAASTALAAYQVSHNPLQYSTAMAGFITSLVDAVYDEPYSGHRAAGSFGLYMSKGVPKNTAWSDFTFGMVDSTDHRTPKTGLTISAYVSKDAAAFGAIAGTVTEISNGIYQLDAAAADMNGDMLIFRFTATGADDTFTTIKTC